MSETTTAATERHQFGAEVGRLLDLVVHSLYSEREIFLRELVANAADATDRRRFEALTRPELGMPTAPRIRVVPDKAARTLTIADEGIGMSKAEMAENLGTIARSGSRAFGETLAQAGERPKDAPSLIGQFGVGFYSAFMVADRVEVTSRRAGTDEAWRWESEGAGEYTLTPANRDEPGTSIVLHLKADADEYLDPFRLESIIRKWADHITIPVVITREGEEVAANEGTAIWRKPKAEVSEESYVEFYRHLSHQFDKPWATLHWHAEGALEFAALLFIPGMRPFEVVEAPRESRVRLHVRRMFITDEANLLPPFLRFVQGVVDTEDLPLNVSREMLQATPVLARIRRAVTNRVLSELKTRAKDDSYPTFWENFGAILKEGLWEDAEHRKELAELARFRSTAVEGWTSLADYLARMKPEQEAIYILVGDAEETLRSSPQLEGFRARGLEVLLLTDPVDAFWPERLGTYQDKPIRSVTQGAADLSKLPAGETGSEPGIDVTKLTAALQAALGDAVREVRGTDRLVDSAVVLAAPESGPDLQMQRLMRRSGRPLPAPPPMLEINPRHPLIRTLAAQAEEGRDLTEAAHTLLDLARVQDGEPPVDPAGFARRVANALAR